MPIDNKDNNSLSDLYQIFYNKQFLNISKDQLILFINSDIVSEYLKFSITINYLNGKLGENFVTFIKDATLIKKQLSFLNNTFNSKFINYISKKCDDFIISAFQKNEDKLLLTWGLYHINVVGPKRIIIFDNGSTDLETKRQLKILAELGIYIDYRFNQKIHFENKGSIIVRETKNILENKVYLLPTDIDEFIFNTKLMSFDAKIIEKTIFNNIAKFNDKNHCIRIDNSFFTLPFCYNIKNCGNKRVFLSKNYAGTLDMGLHLYDFVKREDKIAIKSDDLGYLHFRFRTYDDLIKKTKEKLASRFDITNEKTIRAYKGTGYHVASFLLCDKNKYYSDFVFKHKKDYSIDIKDKWDLTCLPYPFLTDDDSNCNIDFKTDCENLKIDNNEQENIKGTLDDFKVLYLNNKTYEFLSFHKAKIFLNIEDISIVNSKIINPLLYPIYAKINIDKILIYIITNNKIFYINKITYPAKVHLSENQIWLNSVIYNNDNTISLKLNDKFLSFRPDGESSMMPWNRNWEHINIQEI